MMQQRKKRHRGVFPRCFSYLSGACERRAHSIQGVQLLETVTNKMLAEDSGKGFNLDEIVLNYEIINRTPH
jgi:hypothetical protein